MSQLSCCTAGKAASKKTLATCSCSRCGHARVVRRPSGQANVKHRLLHMQECAHACPQRRLSGAANSSWQIWQRSSPSSACRAPSQGAAGQSSGKSPIANPSLVATGCQGDERGRGEGAAVFCLNNAAAFAHR